MKKLSRVLALSLAFIMLIGTTTFAAVPNNSVTIGNRAISIDYIFNYLEDAKVLVNSLLDENPDSSIFFQLDGQNERFTDPFTGTEATEEDLAEVSVFIDENGEEQELEQKELEVVKVSAIEDINVDFGTAVEAIAFPAKVTLNLSDETTVEVDATFACDNYDGNVAGEYVFTATYELPEGVTGDKPVATVKVIVGADPQIAIEAAAEEAVAAYEAAPITTLEEITAAEALEVTANEKVALVTDADKKAAFETRIAAQKALVDAKKAELTALAVESVSAINSIIKNEKEQQLGIAINEDNKVVTVAELQEAGYTVEFLFDKSVTSLTAEKQKAAKEEGIVDGDAFPFNASFKYAVKVTPEEGDAITSDWTTVKVLSATTATEVTGVKLVTTAADYELNYVTVGNTGVSFAALGAKNAFGDELKVANFPEVSKVVALNPTVAYYEAGEIVALKEGKATFEINFTGIEKPETVTVEVKAATKVDSVKESTLKIKNGEDATLTLLDQYGVESTATIGTDAENKVSYKVGEEEAKAVEVESGKITIPTADLNKAGKHTVVITQGEKTLGTVEIEVVDVANAVAESYKIVEANKDVELDLTIGETGETTNTTKDYNFQGIVNGVTLESVADSVADLTKDGGNVVVETKDDKIATAEFAEDSYDKITVEAVKSGETELVVKFVSGDYVKVLATAPITVKNDTPIYTNENVTLKEETEAIAVEGTLNKAAIAAGLTVDGKEFNVAAIDNSTIKLVNLDTKDGKVTGDVIFSTVAAFGGNDFSFPVVITPEAATPTVKTYAKTEAENAGITNYDNVISGPTDGVVTVDTSYLGFGEAATEDQKEAFWAVTAQQGKPDTATAAFGGYVQVTESGYKTKAVFNKDGKLTIYEDGNTENINAWLQIGKKVDGEWKFLTSADAKTDVRTIVWEKAGEYKVNTFTVEWK